MRWWRCCEVEGRSRLKVQNQKLITEPRGRSARREQFNPLLRPFFTFSLFFLEFYFCADPKSDQHRAQILLGGGKTPLALMIYLKPERYFYKVSLGEILVWFYVPADCSIVGGAIDG